MAGKAPSKPVWYWNSYFWISAALVVVALLGLPFLGGDGLIRDPGQKREGGLSLIYLGGALVMFVNGWMSHRQTVLAYQESLEK